MNPRHLHQSPESTEPAASEAVGPVSTLAPPASRQSYAFDAFISYRRADGMLASRWLREKLQGFELPPGVRSCAPPVLRCYLDKVFRSSSPNYKTLLEERLRASKYLILVVTPGVRRPRPGGEPNGVEEEVRYFVSQRGVADVLVVLARGDSVHPLPAGLSGDLRHADIADVRGRPLLTRLFRRYPDPEDELLSLIARLHDVPPQDMPALRQEDRKRRAQATYRRIVLLAAGFILALMLLGYALYQLREARLREMEIHLRAGQRAIESAPTEARLHFVRVTEIANHLQWLGVHDHVARHALSFWTARSAARASWSAGGLRASTLAPQSAGLTALGPDAVLGLGTPENLWLPFEGSADNVAWGAHVRAAFTRGGDGVWLWPGDAPAGHAGTSPVPRVLPQAGPIHDVALYPRGKQLAVARACDIERWGYATEPAGALAGIAAPQCDNDDLSGRSSIDWITYTGKGDLVAALGQDRLVVWRVQDSMRLEQLTLPNPSFFEMDRPRLDADGRRLALPWGRDAVCVIDVNGALPMTCPDANRFVHPAPLASAHIDSVRNALVTTCMDGKARVWSMQSAAQAPQEFDHLGARVLAAASSEDGRHLATGDALGRVRVWDTRSGSLVGIPWQQEREIQQLAWVKGEAQVVSASWDGTVLIHPVQQRQPHRSCRVGAVSVSHASGAGVALYGAGGVSFLGPDCRVRQQRLFTAPSAEAARGVFSRSGRYLLRMTDPPTLWDLEGAPRQPEPTSVQAMRHRDEWELRALADELSDAQHEASVDLSGEAVMRPFALTLQGMPRGMPIASDWNVNEGFAWVVNDSGQFVYWDLEREGTPRSRTLTGENAAPSHLWAVSRDRLRLIVGWAAAGRIQVWSAETLEPTTPPIAVGSAAVWAQFFDADRLMLVAFGNHLGLWDADLGLPVGLPLIHDGPIVALHELNGSAVVVRTQEALHFWDLAPDARPPAVLADEARRIDGATMDTRGVVERVALSELDAIQFAP